jgi:hypothetical protein
MASLMHATQPTEPSLGWPERADEAALRLQKIETAVLIGADCATVHAYATNAALWHEWHPATRAVQGVPNRPLVLGESIVEHIAAGGRHFTAAWKVIAVEAPHLWVIATDAREGSARIVYTVAADAAAPGQPRALFRRTLEFRSNWSWLRWVDPLIARWVLGPQSRRALDRLKRAIEGQA